MVHIDPATLRRYPIIGVLLGGVTAVLLGYLIYSGWPEARALFGQKTPDRLSLHDIVSQRTARWVTLSEGEWHCDRAITTERTQIVERMFRGKIETTEVPITGPIERELLVASFDGELKCAERSGRPLTGVVASNQIFTSRSALQRWRQSGYEVAILNVGASPRWALIMFLGLVTLALGGLVFCLYYLRLMLRPARREGLPGMEPIQPS